MFENYLLISKNTRQTLDQYWLTLVVSSSTAEGLGLDADLASVSKPKKMGRPEKVKGKVDFSIFIFFAMDFRFKNFKISAIFAYYCQICLCLVVAFRKMLSGC